MADNQAAPPRVLSDHGLPKQPIFDFDLPGSPKVDKNKGRVPYLRLTKLAKIHGPWNSIYDRIYDGSTGLSPIDRQDAGNHFDQYWVLKAYHDEMVQKRNWNGWTTNDLIALDAVPHFNGGVSGYFTPNLDNALHPLVDRPQWRTREDLPENEAFHKIGIGRTGYYEAANPDVWNAIKPALMLVSKFLDAAPNSPWWDAFLDVENWEYGEEEEQFPLLNEKGKRYGVPWTHVRSTFRAKSAPLNHADRYRTAERLREVAPHIKLTFGSVDTEDDGLLHRDDGEEMIWTTDANCISLHYLRPGPYAGEANEFQAIVNIPLKHVFQGLSGKLNTREKVMQQHILATAIVHELTHAIYGVMCFQGWAKFSTDMPHPQVEPYYEDEDLAELGWAMEKNVLGVARYARAEQPAFVCFSRDSPTMQEMKNDSIHQRPGHSQLVKERYNMWHPVPMAFYHDLFSKNFWSEIDGLGTGPRPPIRIPFMMGRRYDHRKSFLRDGHVYAGFENWGPHDNRVVHQSHDALEGRYVVNADMMQQLQADLQSSIAADSTLELYGGMLEPNNIYVIDWGKHWHIPLRRGLNQPGLASDFLWRNEKPEKPKRYDHIIRVVLAVSEICCLHTMLAPRPAHLVLDYILRAPAVRDAIQEDKDVEIGVDEWHQFLRYVNHRKRLFFYEPYERLNQANNTMKHFHVEEVSFNPKGWNDVPEIEEQPNPFATVAIASALFKFMEFMADMRMGSTDYNRRMYLLHWALGAGFFRCGRDKDYDLALFYRRYIRFRVAENRREGLKPTADGKEPFMLTPIEFRDAFGMGYIKDWVLGPYNTARYIGGRHSLDKKGQNMWCFWDLREPVELYKKHPDTMSFLDYTSRVQFGRRWEQTTYPLRQEHLEREAARFEKELQPVLLKLVKLGENDDDFEQQVEGWQPSKGMAEMTVHAAQRAGESHVASTLGNNAMVPAAAMFARAKDTILKDKVDSDSQEKIRCEDRGVAIASVKTLMGLWQREYSQLGHDYLKAMFTWVNDTVSKVSSLIGPPESWTWHVRNHHTWLQDVRAILAWMDDAVKAGRWGDYVPFYLLMPSKERLEVYKLNRYFSEDMMKANRTFLGHDWKGKLDQALENHYSQYIMAPLKDADFRDMENYNTQQPTMSWFREVPAATLIQPSVPDAMEGVTRTGLTSKQEGGGPRKLAPRPRPAGEDHVVEDDDTPVPRRTPRRPQMDYDRPNQRPPTTPTILRSRPKQKPLPGTKGNVAGGRDNQPSSNNPNYRGGMHPLTKNPRSLWQWKGGR